mmetsp:Transcript_69450/g.130645  ORF Transcript_69450/g.130645 Transcript_69450/m.130645 type:complete len:388 (-) Transcript_69450:191-1354(-)
MATKRSSKSAKLEEGSERSPKKKASSSSSSSSGEPQYSPEKVSEAFPGCAVSLKPPTRNEPGGAFHFFAAKGASSPDKSLIATFLPNRSPEEVLRAGAFGGTYFRTIDSGVVKQTLKETWRELPDSWIKGLDPRRHLARPWKSYDESVNKFKKKSGTTLEDWESSGWITTHDPFGWFQWYCRFFQGRRCEDDARQIGRWLKCCGPTGRWKGNLCGKVAVAQAAYDDPAVSPVVRQTLLHWGYELTCSDFEAAMKRMGKGKGAYLMNKEQIDHALVGAGEKKSTAATSAKATSAAAATSAAGKGTIEGKLREKVKGALRSKKVEESKVVATEAALFDAATSDKDRFKELTRLLAKELVESPSALTSLNNGSVEPTELVNKCMLALQDP